MATKLIHITVPIDWIAPEIMNTLKAEENAFILDMGCEMIKEARNLVAGLSQKEIYNKISNESKSEIQKLELDLLVQKELLVKMDSSIRSVYEKQLEQMNKQMNELKGKICEHVNNNEEIIKTEICKEKELIKTEICKEKELIKTEMCKEKEKFKILLEEKDKQLTRMNDVYEKFLKPSIETKSSKKLGDEGEDNFVLLSETFKDFIGYKIEKKSHQGHKGDFHLFFEKFNVLVDLKNYTGKVQKKELDKIEHDLSINDTMDFGWLISYESSVSDWNRFPIMCKWIVTDVGLKCIIIVNNLNLNNNPTDVLRIVWNMTNEIHIMMSKTKEIDNKEIEQLRERDYNILQKIKTAQKRLSEMKRNVVSMSQITKDIENDIIDAISMFTNELSKNEFDKSLKIKEWWNDNIDFDDSGEYKLTSTEIWSRFKKENKEYIDENKLLVEDFKTHVKSFVSFDNYIEKSKKGLLEFTGFKFKELSGKELLVSLDNEKIKGVEKQLEVELSIPIVVEKKKKVLKKLVSKEVEQDIVNQYNNSQQNVLEMSKCNNLLVWQIVSILMNNGVISKRGDARGYELYKETEEYKSKITKPSEKDIKYYKMCDDICGVI